METLIGRSWTTVSPGLALDLQLEPDPEGWQLHLSAQKGTDAPRLRVVRGETCEALVEAASTIVALMIDASTEPSSPGEPPVANGPVEPKQPAALEAPLAVTAPSEPNGDRERPKDSKPRLASPSRDQAGSDSPSKNPQRSKLQLHGVVAAELVGDSWTLPQPTLGARLGIGFGGGSWDISAWVLGLLPATTEMGASGQATFWFVAGQLRSCLVLPPSALRLAACGTVEGGWMQGKSEGLDVNGTKGTSSLAIAPELGLRLNLGRARAASLTLSSPFPLIQKQFVVGISEEEIHTLPTVTLRVGLGYSLDFG